MDLTISDFKNLFHKLAECMSENRDALCALDGEIGDADHGIAMEQGMTAAAQAADEVSDGTIQDVFNAAAKGFLNAVGASSGPLYATALMRAGKAAGPRNAMPRADFHLLISAMSDGIAHRGKAEAGQKTMLDAWLPAAEVAAKGGDAKAIIAAANQGADATANMVASLGRSARLGDRSLGHRDPGAVSAALIIEQMCRFGFDGQ